MGEGYVTEEDETADSEQLKKTGKRVSRLQYIVGLIALAAC